ncbi:MAG: M23 family metallopeptidase [Thermaerobacter sp.]|jgi:murein DD-endopeptidase MepM/ murein hydrolase activator NlpD|nr:M23 family metallopeptidase [Thermaerobacter sp.]
MTKRGFTLLIVPHAGAQARRLLVQPRAMLALGITVLLFVGGLVYLGLLYRAVSQKAAELEALKAANRHQAAQLAHLHREAQSIAGTVQHLKAQEGEISTLLRQQKQGLPIGPFVPAQGSLPVLSRGGISRTRDLELTLASLRQTLPQAEQAARALHGTLLSDASFLRSVPSIWPTQGVITSPFGWRNSPLGWGREFHEGVDIGAPLGTPIVATAYGTVEHAGWETGYGNVVELADGNGFSTLYAHMSSIGVRVGQQVTRGQVIGYVGDTGWSTGPHVHYQVMYHGTPMNPAPYLDLSRRI